MSKPTLRIAVEGCGHGSLNAIYASVRKACEVKSWDSIDLLIIGGDFQAVRNLYDLNSVSVPLKFREIGDFHEYYSGARKAPYLTIFIGGNHEASNHLFELYYGGWVAPNIYYLGAANIVQLGPLRIAGISGIWKGYSYEKPHHERLPYNQDDIKSVYHVRELDVRKLLQVNSQVDIGISHDWPRGIEWMGDWKSLFAQKNGFEADARAGRLGSPAARYVLDRLRPPHWFAAHLHCKFSAIVAHDGPEELPNNDPDSHSFSGGMPINSGGRNTDEIDLDLDELGITVDATDQNRNQASNQQVQIAVARQADGDLERLRDQLPASFARPAPPVASAKTGTLTAIKNRETRFLALDKCLPNRKFLQLLEIEPVHEMTLKPPTRPYKLCYDKEWLAISRAFASELTLGSASTPVPPSKDETFYRELIDKELMWVNKNIGEVLQIPDNFEITAPVYDLTIGIGKQEQPREVTNPQTARYCEMLAIKNLFDLTEDERDERIKTGPRKSRGEVTGSRNSQGRNRNFRGRGRGQYKR